MAPLRREPRRRLAECLAERFRSDDLSIAELAAAVRCRPTVVRKLLEEAGVHDEHGALLGLPDDVLAHELARRYRDGLSVAALSRDTGIAHRVVKRILIREGCVIPVRRSGTDALASILVARYEAGATLRELAAEVDRSYSSVRRVLLEAGVVLRTRGERHPSRA